jgi:hypothetical protein
MHALLFATQVPGFPAPVSQHAPVEEHFGADAQQAAMFAPHGGTHVPLVHMPPFMQVPVFATHLPFVSQQPPLAHTLPGQHACVAPPHVWHVPLTHVSPAVEHAMPLATQVFIAAGSQQPPPLQTLPAQHAASAVPQVWHVPSVALLHTWLGVEHAAPFA